MCRNALAALAKDTRNEVDFLAAAVQAPQENSVRPSTPTKGKQSDLVELVDDCIDQLQKENTKHKTCWNQEKEKGRRTYGSKVKGERWEESSPAYPGEEVWAGRETERNLNLPLVGLTTGTDKVDRWLEHGHHDLLSQPSASQAGVSTPLAGRGRPQSVRSMGDISNISPLSPINLNVQPRQQAERVKKRKAERATVVKDMEELQTSCPVDINDSFDKLLLSSSKKKKKKEDQAAPATVTLSPEDSEGMPPLLTADESKEVLRKSFVEDSTEDVIGISPSIETEKSFSPPKNSPVIERTTFKDEEEITDNNHIGTNKNIEEEPNISFNDPIHDGSAEPFDPPRTETEREEATDAGNKMEVDITMMTDQGNKSNEKTRFFLLGRMSRSVNTSREKVAKFIQLGLLASPRTSNFSLPLLKDIVTKRNLLIEDIHEPAGVGAVEGLDKNEMKDTEYPASILQEHLKTIKPTDQKKESAQQPSESESLEIPPLRTQRVESSYSEVRQPWVINTTYQSSDNNQTAFMESILGDKQDLYTQEVETPQDVSVRVANVELEESLRVEAKRVRSEDSDIEDSSPIRAERKVARIESDSEDESQETFIATQQRLVSRPRRAGPVSRTRTQESSSVTDSETGERLSTKEVEEKIRMAEEKARQLQEGLEEEQEVFQTETMDMEPSQALSLKSAVVADSDEDIFSATPEKVLLPAQSKSPRLSPVPEWSNIQTPDTSNWKFVLSNLSVDQKTECERFIESLDCLGVSPKVDDSVTHVIMNTDDNLQTPRTLKYLQAVASGLLIVSFSWVEACLEDRGRLAIAEEWEVSDLEMEGANGPCRSRMRREQKRRLLLAGFEVFTEGDVENLTKPVFNDLLTRVGARRVHSLSSFSFTRDIIRIIIINSVEVYELQNTLKRLKKERIAVVEKEWLLDTIASHSVLPLLSYMTPGITEEMLVKAGYSYPLVGQE